MSDRTREDFGVVIRDIRLKNGVKQIDVAKGMHISQARISRLERGHGDPHLFEIVEYSYRIGSGPSAIMKEAARIWSDYHDFALGKDVNPDLLMFRTHEFLKQHECSPDAQDEKH